MLVRIWNNMQSNLFFWECRLAQTLLESVENSHFMWPNNQLLNVGPKYLNTYAHSKTCAEMFTAASLLVAKIWKKVIWIKGINKWWFRDKKEYYSALKCNELSIHESHGEELHAWWSVKEISPKCYILTKHNMEKINCGDILKGSGDWVWGWEYE